MKKLISLLLCLGLVLSLAACAGEPKPTEAPTNAPTETPTTEPTTVPTEPPITVESVYASVLDAMSQNEATRMRVEIGFSASYEEGEGEDAVTTKVGYAMLLDTIVSKDPLHCYNLSSIAFDTDGFQMELDVDMYILEEEGHVVTYGQVFGMWVREDTGMTVEEFLSSGELPEISTGDIWAGGALPADMTLDESTQMLDGTEVYILRSSIPSDGLQDALVEMGVELDENADEVAMPVVYYVDAKNYTILRVEADMTVLSDLLSAALAESLVGSEAEAGALTMDISNAVYEMGYGDQEVPALPQEALDYIANDESFFGGEEEYEDPTEYEGPPILNCGSEQLLLTCPEGYFVEYYGDTNIMLNADDYSTNGDFFYYETLTRDEVLDTAGFYAESLEFMEMKVTQGEGPEIEGYETWQVIGEDQSYYFAWREAGDGWLLLQVYDFSGADDATEILPFFLNCITAE